ncbi:MAG: glutamate--tRNA ligase [Deltaproteobacteria bacterium]|nr:glutamate--tRNA ligase [Deltaproteobacteria bacterium]
MSVRTRFAPSPTGALHIGGARTAIFDWLFARHYGGKFILRIEDTDQTRSTEESIAEILDAMIWLGLDWDEGPFRQSERLSVYQSHVEKLLETGKAYRCYCTPEELEARRKKAQSQGKVYRYEGKCRNSFDRACPEPAEGLTTGLKSHLENSSFAVRLMTPEIGSIVVEDLIRGTITFDAKEIDDFIIQKTDGFPTYNFAVVIDDVTMNITHVIRGDDHIANTPKQILIYEALGYETPKFAHVSMILGSDKTKLSKRHGATSTVAYREMGYLPEALVNYLARLGWSYGDQEVFSKEELVEKFTLDNVGKSPAVFNPEKLLWLNGLYIRNKPAEEIAKLVIPFLEKKGFQVTLDERLIKIVESLRERAKTLVDFAEAADYFFIEEVKYEEGAKKKFLTPEALPIFETLIDKLSSLNDFTIPEMQRIFNEIIEERGLKLVKVAQPVRVALTGGTVSPGIFEVMDILGRDKVIERIKKAVSYISNN